VTREGGREGNSRGFTELLKDLAHGSADLFRGEVTLARMELAAVAANVARGATQVALGGVLVLLGALSLLAGIILLAGDQWLPRDLYWLAALIAVVAMGLLAGWFARRGLTLLSPSHLAPDETVATLKEDKEWLKQQLTSGATSS
jgi:uncharacterized membrane protein YqjE